MTRVVAEVSSNHHGSLERCLEFVRVAAEVGCAAVKFQQFRVRELFCAEALARSEDLRSREAWELPEAFNRDLSIACADHGVAFSSTPFYLDAVPLLEPLVSFFKLASYQLLWDRMLHEVAQTSRPVVLATGMATLDEVAHAVDVLRAGGCRDLTILHCVSLYPTAPEDANLAAIETLRSTFDVPAGWSDHTVDPRVVRRAVHRFGATMVELHLDLDGAGDEFHAGHCWLPGALAETIQSLDAVGADADPAPRPMDGDGIKAPREREAHERGWRSDPSDGLRPLLATRAAELA